MHKSIRSRFVRSARGPAALAAALALSLAGLALGAAPAAEASSIAHVTSTAPCNVTVTAGSGAVVGSFIVGVTAGSTQLSFDCNAASSAGVAAEASLLAGIGTTAVTQSSEADISAIAQFTASATDTGCPAGAAGACTQATFPVPANFSAGDANATCPATAAQVNAGLYGCAIAIATTSLQPLAGGEYLLVYASQTTPPAAPTIAATVADGPPGSTVTVSDAAATSSYWWANAISQSQTSALGLPPVAPPASCGASAGYGNVPSPFLAVNWFAAGSSTAIAGSAAGISISDACYDGTTLYAPALSGTIPVPSTLTNGTVYTAYVCEADITSFPSNDPNAATDCGTPLPGTSGWIDASFSFTAAAGTPQAALSVTSATGTVGTSITLATTGGSGTGAVTFAAVGGTASGCAVTGGALSATSAGTCVVTATKASDSTYLAVNSTPTTITFAAPPPPTVTLSTTKVTLTGKSKTLGVRISCAGSACSGNLTAKVSLTTRKAGKDHPITVTYTFGPVAYNVSAGSSATVTTHLSKAFMSYLKINPKHKTLYATILVTDNLGKKHTLGRVSLLK